MSSCLIMSSVARESWGEAAGGHTRRGAAAGCIGGWGLRSRHAGLRGTESGRLGPQGPRDPDFLLAKARLLEAKTNLPRFIAYKREQGL
jgi:hypothetical protein